MGMTLTPTENAAIAAIQNVIEGPTLRRHLLPVYRRAIKAGAHPHTGWCSHASDALRRILGGNINKFRGYQLERVSHEGGSHYYLRNDIGAIPDTTVAQFQTVPPYHLGKPVGLATPRKIKADHPGEMVQAPTNGAADILAALSSLE